MFARSLLARSNTLRLRQVYPSSPSSSRPLHLARRALSFTNLRRFSAAPALHSEQIDQPISQPPSGTCFIANIPFKVTAEQLKEAFSEFGKVESVKLVTTDAGLFKGIGFVQFETVAEAVHFYEANQVDPIFLLDRRLYVEHAKRPINAPVPREPSDTLRVLNVRRSEAELLNMFGSSKEKVLAIRFHKKNVDSPSKVAFVQFRNVDVAMEAMEAFKNKNGETQIDYARPAKSYSLVSRLSQHPAA